MNNTHWQKNKLMNYWDPCLTTARRIKTWVKTTYQLLVHFVKYCKSDVMKSQNLDNSGILASKKYEIYMLCSLKNQCCQLSAETFFFKGLFDLYAPSWARRPIRRNWNFMLSCPLGNEFELLSTFHDFSSLLLLLQRESQKFRLYSSESAHEK